MKMSETDFRVITVPYIKYCELEEGIKNGIKPLEEFGKIFQSFTIIKDYAIYDHENPYLEKSRVCVLLLIFKESKARQKPVNRR